MQQIYHRFSHNYLTCYTVSVCRQTWCFFFFFFYVSICMGILSFDHSAFCRCQTYCILIDSGVAFKKKKKCLPDSRVAGHPMRLTSWHLLTSGLLASHVHPKPPRDQAMPGNLSWRLSSSAPPTPPPPPAINTTHLAHELSPPPVCLSILQESVGFPAGLDGNESACNVGDLGLVPGLRRSSGEGNDNPV